MPVALRLPPILAVALLLLSSRATAQTVEWGGVLRAAVGSPTSITRDSGVVNRFGSTGTGTSLRYSVGAGGALRLPWLLLDLTALAGYERFRSNPYTTSFFDTATARTISVQQEFSLGATTFGLELAGRVPLRIAEGWEIAPGGWLGLRLGINAEVTERIIPPTPDSIRFPDSTRERTVADTLPISRSAFRGGGMVELGGPQLPIFGSLLLRPAAELRLDGGALAEGDNLLTSLSFGVNVTVFPRPSEPVIDTPHPPRPDTPAPPLTIALDFIAEGAIPSPALARPEREQVLTVVPWPCISGFAEGSTTLPARFREKPAEPFTLGALAQRPPDTVVGAVLNILRLRSNAHPDAEIRLIGHARNSGELKLARGRAESVKRALVTLHKLDPEMLRVEAVVDSVGDCVEIASELAAITEPIVVEWLVRRLRAPTLLIRPGVTQPGEARSWGLQVERAGRTLLDEAGAGAPPPEGWSRRLPLYNLLDPEPLPPLVATLRVLDSAGGEHKASATLRVGVAREHDTTRFARQTVVLHLPAEGATPTTTDALERALRRAASLAGKGPLVQGPPTARARVMEYLPAGATPRTGNDAVGDEYRSPHWSSVTLESRPTTQ